MSRCHVTLHGCLQRRRRDDDRYWNDRSFLDVRRRDVESQVSASHAAEQRSAAVCGRAGGVFNYIRAARLQYRAHARTHTHTRLTALFPGLPR